MLSFLLSAVQSATTRRLLTGGIIVGRIGAETGLLVLNRFILSGMYFSTSAAVATFWRFMSDNLNANLKW